MSYTTGAEIIKKKYKDGRTMAALKREIESLKEILKIHELTIATIQKENQDLRQLITSLKMKDESITGDC